LSELTARPYVIPAVDVLGDEAVRLLRGEFARVTHRAGDPLELVRRWAAAEPTFVHVVDLGAARAGGLRRELVASAAEAAGDVPLQFAGGVRAPEDAVAAVEAGAARVIVGTAAFTGDVNDYVDAIGDRLVVALDVRAGRVATDGWERDRLSLDDALERCGRVPRFLCTAIDRDGTLGGPDVKLLQHVASSGKPVIAAGGISTEDDLDRIPFCEAAVSGRALLEGRIPLSALRAGRPPRRAEGRRSSSEPGPSPTR
jgi:phosphoribosylformimino-5-aminoimidazole carboxamide ribonucleotide (ProFAR) isomerase